MLASLHQIPRHSCSVKETAFHASVSMFTSAGTKKQPYLGAPGLCLWLGQAMPAGGMFQIFLRELRLYAAWTRF